MLNRSFLLHIKDSPGNTDKITYRLLFLIILPPPELLPVLGLLERPTLDAALLCNSTAGSDLGVCLDWLEELYFLRLM